MSRATQVFKYYDPKGIPDTVNKELYPAFSKDTYEQYIQMLLTNTVGNTFYASSDELLKESMTLHEIMVKKDPEFVAKAIIYARTYGYMRLQPIVGLVYLLGSYSESVDHATTFNTVIKTPNDLIDFVTILKSIRGNEGGRHIKRIVSNWLKNLSEYWVIKYGAETSGKYSLKDLVKIYHPDFNGNKLALFDYILGKEVKSFETIQQINWFEKLKQASTATEKVNSITRGRLPHEVATTFAGASEDVWSAIIPQMPIFALLKNLATIERHGLADKFKTLITSKFSDLGSIVNSKILPFRFLEASKKVVTPYIRDALRGALELSFSNIDKITGTTAIAIDTSGSMKGDPLQKAGIFGVCLAKKSDAIVYTFDYHAKEIEISKHDSILTQVEQKFVARGGTNTESVIKKLLDDKKKVDNIILITDEQQNIGMPFFPTFEIYKRYINPKVKLFIIDVAAYSNSALTPADKNIYYIYGWSDKVLSFISLASRGFDSIVQFINTGDNV